MAGPAAMRRDALEAQAERGELSRYAADYLAALAPLGVSLAAGALASLGVYVVPIAVVLVSFLVLRLAYVAVVPASALVVGLFRWIAGPPQRGAVAPDAVPTAMAPAPLPTSSIEPMMDPAGRGELWAVALVVFWPVAMLAIGMVAAAVYRARRARRLDDLSRHPVDFSSLPEVVLFYALTAASALLVGLDSFVALAANVAFAWAGYIIWRWLYDRLLRRLAPVPLRAAALAQAGAEAALRRRLRESG